MNRHIEPMILSFILLLAPALASAYPNGPLLYVTDAAPFCASCHAVAKAAYMPELPPEVAEKELAENKHYGLIRSPAPPSPYLELSAAQKEAVIREAKQIDNNASVEITTPARVEAGQALSVTVKARGGNGPAIGVMLVDKPLRFQARTITADGWQIVTAPTVTGQNGKPQTAWLARRFAGLGRNLNFVLIEDQRYDPDKRVLPAGEVVYTLKAPLTPGNYSLSAAFLYGTENANTAGVFQRPSGRILFSDEITVQVE